MKRYLALLIPALLAICLAAQHPGSFEFGKRMYEDGFHQEAKIVFERIIAANPTSSEAEESYYLLAGIYKDDGELSQAEEYYRTLFETFPQGRYREEALLNWALSQHQQEKFSQSLETFNRFINTFPTSAKRIEALYYLIDSHYNLANYSRVLTIGSTFISDHSEHANVPDVMLLTAKSHIRLQNYNDGENTLDMIISRHPKTNARWESVLEKVELLYERHNSSRAADELEKHVEQPDIPRYYEEQFRKRLTSFYLQDGRKDEGRQQLRELINKFDRSPDIAKYLYQKSGLLIDSGRFSDVTDYFERFEKDIQGAEYQFDLLVNIAEAYFRSGETVNADNLLSSLRLLERDGVQPVDAENSYSIAYWRARLQEHRGLLVDAIDTYQELLTEVPANSVWYYESLMRIGDIYLERLSLPATALTYYNMIILGIAPSQQILAGAYYKTALCYEDQGEYREALKSLNQINTDYLSDDEQKRKVENMIELLRRFKIVDYEKTTSNLLFSLIDFLEHDEREQLKDRLIEIAVYDLKNPQSVTELLAQETSAKSFYIMGKAHLQKIHQSILEDESFTAYQRSLDNNIRRLQYEVESNPEYRQWLAELDIEKAFLANNRELNADILSKIEDYLREYTQGPAVNRFNFLAGNYYLQDRIFVEADKFLQNVALQHDIPLQDYRRAFTLMGDYYFDNRDFGRAITYYERLEQTVARPELMHRYAIALLNTSQPQQGAHLLDLLVRNNADFQGVEKAIEVLAEYHQGRNDYHSIVNIMVLLPEARRSPAFYRQLSNAYMQIGEKQRAKESLMNIPDKDNEVLRMLAELQYLTDDIVMAQHTYSLLAEEETDQEHKMTALAMLGHIEYLSENWQDAVTYYGQVTDYLQGKSGLGVLPAHTIVKETVVSLYRINNRPRAESVQDSFSTIIDNNIQAKARIFLNEGIYQMSVNRSRAARTFRNIIRNDDFPQSIRYEAYFWRGVNSLENRDIDDAYEDFQQASRSSDINLRNEAYLKLGTINFSRENYQQALDHYFTVIRDDKTGSLALDAARNFAIVCKTIKEWQKAIDAYNIILERGGEGQLEGETIFDIAFCYYRDRQYENAIPMFERAIGLLDDRETKAEAQYWIGESYANLGQYDRAATEYLKVGYYYPDLVQFVATSELKLSEAYIRQGRVDAARSVLERIINRYGRDSDWGRQAVLILEQI